MSRAKLLATTLLAAAAMTGAALPFPASAQAAAAQPPVRLSGVIVFADAKTLIVKDQGGEVVSMARAPQMNVTEFMTLAMSAIKPNSFIGVGAKPQPDGTQRAVQVMVFPESARGQNEGFGPWSVVSQGTMTNATVATLDGAPAAVPGGRKLLLRYKGGEQTVIVPRGTPVMTWKPGVDATDLLLQGAPVIVTAQLKDGQPTALRVLVGRKA